MEAIIHYLLKNTKVEGPKRRYCIWFQGCSKRCKGCFSKATWDFEGGYKIDCDKLLEDIFKQKHIEGVTFLGGEPFEQYEALEYLSKNIHSKNLGIVCFTGKLFEEIKSNYPNILPYIDLLIDGGFEEDKKDYSRPWVGSKNQKYYFLSERYNENIIKQYKNAFEINIKKNGEFFINGMGDIEELLKRLEYPYKN